jgi:hypothetical protein
MAPLQLNRPCGPQRPTLLVRLTEPEDWVVPVLAGQAKENIPDPVACSMHQRPPAAVLAAFDCANRLWRYSSRELGATLAGWAPVHWHPPECAQRPEGRPPVDDI